MTDKKESMGEFWDQWIEEMEEEKRQTQELIEKRKQEAKKKYENTGEGRTV